MTELKKMMALTKVDSIPDDTTPLRRTLLTFLNSDMDMAQVDWKSNYGNSSSAISSMRAAILSDERFCETIDVCKRADNVYLYRKGKVVID